MNRREFLKFAGTAAVSATLSPVLSRAGVEKGSGRPNVIVFLADDLGYGDLGCYGHPFIKTPNLDRFAAQGMRFTECYAAAPICSPSRAALLTGRVSYRVGVYHLAGESVHLRTQERTIAELLRPAGYATCFLGKWHLGELDGSDPTPEQQGFDHWFATRANCFPKNPADFIRNGAALGEIKGSYCEIVVDEAIDWLRQIESSRPFFIELCTSEPHTPVAPPAEFAAMYEDSKIEKLAKKIKYGRIDRNPNIDNAPAQRRQYYGTVTQLDAAFGKLMKALDEMKRSENTIVIFTSDNGPEFPGGSTRIDLLRNRSWGTPGKLRGMKRHLYEGGIRVAGIIRWPRRIKRAGVCGEAISSVDFLPTICEACGVDVPGDRVIDGVSIISAFDGKKLKRTRPLCWNINYTGVPNMAMRVGDEVLLGFADEPKPGQSLMEWIKGSTLARFELYNVQTDVMQSIDLAKERSAHLDLLIGQMRRLWREIREEGPTWGHLGRIKPAVGKFWPD